MTDTLEILDEVMIRVKKLEDQVGWIIDRNVGTVSNERVEKLEIQVNCLRKQILDLEGKKSYSEEVDLEHEQDVKRGLYGEN